MEASNWSLMLFIAFRSPQPLTIISNGARSISNPSIYVLQSSNDTHKTNTHQCKIKVSLRPLAFYRASHRHLNDKVASLLHCMIFVSQLGFQPTSPTLKVCNSFSPKYIWRTQCLSVCCNCKCECTKKKQTLWSLAQRTKLNLDFTTQKTLLLHKKLIVGFVLYNRFIDREEEEWIYRESICYFCLYNNYSPANIMENIITLPSCSEESSYLLRVLKSELGTLSIFWVLELFMIYIERSHSASTTKVLILHITVVTSVYVCK